MTETDIARVCHEVNRAYCQALGDTSQPAWDDAPEWQRSSALMGVRLHLNNPDAGPQASHESWMAQKVAEGWVYGPTKDPEAKTHHCIVPFDQLPREQQAKDFIFRAVVHALRKHGPEPTVTSVAELDAWLATKFKCRDGVPCAWYYRDGTECQDIPAAQDPRPRWWYISIGMATSHPEMGESHLAMAIQTKFQMMLAAHPDLVGAPLVWRRRFSFQTEENFEDSSETRKTITGRLVIEDDRATKFLAMSPALKAECAPATVI